MRSTVAIMTLPVACAAAGATESHARLSTAGGTPVFVEQTRIEPHGDPGVGLGVLIYSVAISQDTAVVGELGQLPGDLGAAHVLVRVGASWTEQQALPPPDSSDSSFGYAESVAVSGDTLVVGDPEGPQHGAAFVFVRTGAVWTLQQKLVATDAAVNDHFGVSVAVAGDTILVGATGAASGLGSVYAFARAGNVWTERQELGPDPGAGAWSAFGTALSMSGGTAAIGAPGDGATGAAYVFINAGGMWVEEQRLPTVGPGTGFGSAVSVSGDTLAVSKYHDPTGGNQTGAVYVFVRSGGSWSLQQSLFPPAGTPEDSYFGSPLSVEDDLLVVGSPGENNDAGAAHVFVRSGSTWAEEPELLAPGGEAGYFSSSVCLSGGRVTIGASASGRAFIFARSGAGWSLEEDYVAPDIPLGDELGVSVALSGNTLAVGAPYDTTLAGAQSGSVSVFVRSGAGWIEQQKIVGDESVNPPWFGAAVALSGDTLVVGAPQGYPGWVSIYVRTGTVWTEEQKLFPPNGSGDIFGTSVSLSGNTLVIGAPSYPNLRAFVYVRSGTIWSLEQELVPFASGGILAFGEAVAVSGDTVLVGAPDGTVGGTGGAAYLFVRTGTTWAQQQVLAIPGVRMGESVALDGDTAVVGAPVPNSAYVFVRSGTTWAEQQQLQIPVHSYFGTSLALSGDTAAIGAIADDPNGAGSAYIFVRSGTTWSEQQKLIPSDGMSQERFGASVAIEGINAVVGAPLHVGGPDFGPIGEAFVYQAVTETDASVTKTDGQTNAVPGTPVTYALTVADAGPDPGLSLHVLDPTPAELTITAWTCTATPGSFCPGYGSGAIDHTANVDVGGTLTYTVTGVVSPSATGSLVNTVSVTPPAGVSDPVPSNNSATDTDTLTPQADLGLDMAGSPNPIAPGNTLTYTLQARNLGPSDSTGATITDALPGTLTLLSSSPGCSTAGGTVTCTLAGSAPNTSQNVTLQAIVNPGTVGSFANTASLAGNETDAVSGNDTATELTQVSLRELVHGTALSADLRAAGGILADQDLYRIAQKPYSSYAVVVDATSANISSGQGPGLDRLGSDASTVLQSSQAAGAASSRRLSWENESAASVLDQFLRVRSGGCSTTCTPADVYRIQAWDTTLAGPRFNNSGTQVTVLVLQNTTGAPVIGHVHFWDASGTLLATQPVSLAPNASLALNTSTLVAGQSGSLTMSHDGGYGGLTGKAVSIESATGFSFDTPLVPRPR